MRVLRQTARVSGSPDAMPAGYRAVQEESDTLVSYRGVDTLFSLMPPNWGRGAAFVRGATTWSSTSRCRSRTRCRSGWTRWRAWKCSRHEATTAWFTPTA